MDTRIIITTEPICTAYAYGKTTLLYMEEGCGHKKQQLWKGGRIKWQSIKAGSLYANRSREAMHSQPRDPTHE